MNKTIFTIIGWLSVVTIPVAPAYFFGEAVMKQANEYAPYSLAVIVGICAAMGMEGVGIYAGHTAVQAFRLGRWWLGTGAAVILLAYVGIGASKLTGFGQTMFFVAPLSYLILGINHAVEVAETKEAQSENEAQLASEEQLAADRADKQAEAERAQQLKLAQLAAQKEVQLAKVTAATSRQDSGNLPQEKRQHSGNPQWDYTDWRLVPLEIKQKIATMTAPELAPIMPHLGDTTRRSWVRKAKAEYGNLPPHSPYVAEQGASGD